LRDVVSATLQVRGKLLAESKGAAQQEERKKQRQQKVFGKEASLTASAR